MRLVLVTLLIFSSLFAYTQNEFGFLASGTRVKITGDQVELDGLTMRADLGLRVGAFYNFQIQEDVLLQIGVNYFGYSGVLQTLDTLFEISQPIVGQPPQFIIRTEWRDSVRLKLNTVEFPLTFNVTSDNKHWEFGSGVLASVPIKVTRTDLDGTANIRDEFNTMNLGILFSAAYKIPIRRNTIRVLLSYAQGIINITRVDVQNEFNRIKASSINLGLNWSIKTRKE